jgi:hypothetical protein
LLVTLFAGSGILGVSGVAAAQYTDPPPTNGPSADPGSSGVASRNSDNFSKSADSNNSDQFSQSSGWSLPITGGDVLGLVVGGIGAVALGAVLVTIRRRALRV